MTAYQNQKIRLIMSLRTAGVQDMAVLNAMEAVPRDHFISPDMADQAYEDIAVPIGLGQTISQPFIVAKMTETLALNDRHRVLEIGTGTGYQASVLSKIARRVYTIERHRPLYEAAQKNFHALGLRNVTPLYGDGMKGWPVINGIAPDPFDRIIVTAAAADKPPPVLIDQLAVGGIMVIPVGRTGAQVLKKIVKESAETYAISDIMPVRFVPLLPDVDAVAKRVQEAV